MRKGLASVSIREWNKEEILVGITDLQREDLSGERLESRGAIGWAVIQGPIGKKKKGSGSDVRRQNMQHGRDGSWQTIKWNPTKRETEKKRKGFRWQKLREDVAEGTRSLLRVFRFEVEKKMSSEIEIAKMKAVPRATLNNFQKSNS